MLHLCGLQDLCCICVVERDREVVGTLTDFPPLDMSCLALFLDSLFDLALHHLQMVSKLILWMATALFHCSICNSIVEEEPWAATNKQHLCNAAPAICGKAPGMLRFGVHLSWPDKIIWRGFVVRVNDCAMLAVSGSA